MKIRKFFKLHKPAEEGLIKKPFPLLFWIPAVLAVLFIALTFLGLLINIPWSDIFSFITNSTVRQALRTSLIVSFLAAFFSGILGLPLALLIHKSTGIIRTSLRSLIFLPLVLPPVVGGTALLFAFGRNGLFGKWLYDWTGITLPFTTAGAVLAAIFVALPFFVLSAETALLQTNPELEESAQAIGANGFKMFSKVIFPQILPGVLTGLLLSWARALGEFGATITFAGNLAGRTQTLPLAVFETLESGRSNEALAISLLLMLIGAIVLILFQSRWIPALVGKKG